MQTQSIPRSAKLRQHPLKGWFDVRQRSVSGVIFVINRLTGLGLTLYLILHLIVLSILLQGPDGWDAFIRMARSPLFLSLDVVLFFGLLFHGLNGIRIALIGSGIAASHSRLLIWVLGLIGIVLLIASAVLIFTI